MTRLSVQIQPQTVAERKQAAELAKAFGVNAMPEGEVAFVVEGKTLEDLTGLIAEIERFSHKALFYCTA